MAYDFIYGLWFKFNRLEKPGVNRYFRTKVKPHFLVRAFGNTWLG